MHSGEMVDSHTNKAYTQDELGEPRSARKQGSMKRKETTGEGMGKKKGEKEGREAGRK